jgi:putative endonuclease
MSAATTVQVQGAGCQRAEPDFAKSTLIVDDLAVMLNNHQKIGKKGEALAVKSLKRQGYKILSCNYRNVLGEIDIIARDGRCIVFVEVKTRRSSRFGDAKYSVTAAKQRKLSMVALSYLKEQKLIDHSARFDVVTIRMDHTVPHIELIKNAFVVAYA